MKYITEGIYSRSKLLTVFSDGVYKSTKERSFAEPVLHPSVSNFIYPLPFATS
jgi:hypothetical protein